MLAKEPAVELVLTNSSAKPIYANAYAVQILAYPEDVKKLRSPKSFLTTRTRSIIPNTDISTQALVSREIISGNRRYVCRIFSLGSNPKNSTEPAIAILLERPFNGSHDIRRLCQEYHLTPREQQAVELLMQGLVSKQIADRMEISPNTVKAFLRLVMVKMGVGTRSGIMAKLMHSTS